MKFRLFQKKYPKFVYQNYSCKVSKKGISISFNFRIEALKKGGIFFNPKISIKNLKGIKIKKDSLDNLVFNLGMIEMLSYWKCVCSPEIDIKAGYLNKEQAKWWKNVILKGMGQFFFENKIDFRKNNFLNIKSSCKEPKGFVLESLSGSNGFLVPIGGGKDSIVALEALKKVKKDILCFSLNPTKETKKILKIGGCGNPVIALRKIDKKLLEMNRRGFLNGHTPFSAYLAFLSVLVAAASGLKYAALSNERSSNEGNTEYLGKIINHQWSKSFEFEELFRSYCQKYLLKGLEYFSFLRPFYELQIARTFSQHPQYFSSFLSCNEAHKTASGPKKPLGVWCGKCPKCLFAFVVLYPFLKEKDLFRIFKKNLFEDKGLIPIMEELTGERGIKPFECVGTHKESLAAFYLSLKKALETGKLPALLSYFERNILPKHLNLKKEAERILNSFDKNNNLPKNI